MKRTRYAIGEKKERLRLGTEKIGNTDRQDTFTRKKKRVRLRSAYVLATACALFCTLTAIALIIGLGGWRTSLDGGDIADKIAGLFCSIDFFDAKEFKESADEDDFIMIPSQSGDGETGRGDDGEEEEVEVGKTHGGIYDFDYSLVPEGCTPIIPMDLSLSSYGPFYINNTTGYDPDIKELLRRDLSSVDGYVPISVRKGPTVLIIHTHGTEAYSEDGAKYTDDTDGYARTNDTRKNVVAVGETVSEILNSNGIPTLHCKKMHDSIQYRDSYARAEDTIREYMSAYPTIRLVIDIHRDSVIRSTGEIVRTVTELDGEEAAQIMCVVGSDWKGENCPQWENNLSLALKLRESLNGQCENICRPVFLKGNTYNQEISEYSLLVELGSSGNSLEEAQRSARLLGEELSKLFEQI